jgi:CBS domain containing-hemolysin-like protein
MEKAGARALARERHDAAGRFPPRISRAARCAEVETMGGLLTHLLGVVPEPGNRRSFRGLKLTRSVTVDERRVRELLVQRVK